VELPRLQRQSERAAELTRRAGVTDGTLSRASTVLFAPETVAAAFDRISQGLNDVGRNCQTVTGSTATSWLFPSTDDVLHTIVDTSLEAIERDLRMILAAEVARQVIRRTSQPDPPPRLITQIYRPDVWMVAPPRCNVFFPEMYSSFSYSRNFQQEITRMLLRTHSAFFGSDMFFDGFYMAPSNILGSRRGRSPLGGRGGDEHPEGSDAPVWVRRDLLEHELYTGIIPAFERMSDLNLHALRGGAVDVNGVRVGYAQLACNHIFFQYRFRSRQLSLSGKNNPYAVLGFPMLVIDKYLPIDHLRDGEYRAATAARLEEAIREGEGEIGTPEEQAVVREANTARVNEIIAEVAAQRPNTHYLGTPASISFSLDASSGGTINIQMEYARDTNERAEFFGDNVGRTGRARHTRNQRIRTTVAALDQPAVGARGPRQGEIVEVTDVTDAYLARERRRSRRTDDSARSTTDTRLPLFIPNARATGRRRGGTRVTVGVERPARDYGPEVVALVGTGGNIDASTGEVLVEFKAWEVTEDIGVYTREDVELPPEDITFPPWYGESWRTNRVGALYAYLLGTGALTDPTIILSPSGAEAARVEAEGEGADRSITVRLAEAYAGVSRNTAPGGTSAEAPPPGYSEVLPVGDSEEAGPARASDPEVEATLGTIPIRSPIAQATEEIVRAYSQIKLNKYDVHEFLRAYTWRPVASMVDLFGTANLEISDEGEVLRGREGFHSRAFGDYDDLRQLVGPSDTGRPRTILGLTTAESDESGDRADRDSAISARLDTRKEKRVCVLRYLDSLLAGRGGILG
jgi:hypothetical protein